MTFKCGAVQHAYMWKLLSKLLYSPGENVHHKIAPRVTLFAVFLPGNIVPQDAKAAGSNEMYFSYSHFSFQCIKQLFKLLV